MSVIKKMRITAVNMPPGTMTVMWNGDTEMEWNYNLPLDEETGLPLEGDELFRHLISVSYDSVKVVLDSRAEALMRSKVDFKGFDTMLRKQVDLEEMVREYEEIIGITPTMG